jgi:G3E family GTPase
VGAGRRATPELWLETSGLADPRRIVELIAADAMLARRIQVAEVVLIVDAANLRQQLADTGLVVRQIQSATRLVLAKADLVDAAELAQACATLRLLNPAAAIEASERGTRRRLQPDAAARPWPVAADGAGAAAATAVSLRPAAGADWGALSVWLSALLCAAGGDVLRVKGVIATPAGRLLLQSVRDKVQPPQLLPPAPEGQEPAAEAPANALVVIGRNLDEARLRASLAYWTGGS